MNPTQRRNLWIALGAAAAVVAAIVLVVVLVGDDDEQDVVAGDATTTTSELETTSTTHDGTTTTVARDGEERVVAVDGDGQVVTLDADTGEVQDVLLEGVSVNDPAKNDIAVTPSGQAAYVVRPGGSGTEPTIVQIPLLGGEPVDVATGLAPAVSPDGERLAYVAFEGPEAEPRIVVRELIDGSEKAIAPGDERPFVFISDLAWTGEGEIAFIAGEVQTGAWVVSVESDDLDAARRLGPTARKEGARWVAVSRFEDGLAVSEFCCDTPADRHLLLAVSLDPIQVEGGLLEREYAISRVDANAAGDSLVFVADVRPGGGTLYRWDGEGEAQQLTDNVVAAAW